VTETIEWRSVHETDPPAHDELLLQVRTEKGLLVVCVTVMASGCCMRGMRIVRYFGGHICRMGQKTNELY
jgi:hypothetical protein